MGNLHSLVQIVKTEASGVPQRQTEISVSYRNHRYQAPWYRYQYRSRSSLFLSLGISPGIDPEDCAFFASFEQISY